MVLCSASRRGEKLIPGNAIHDGTEREDVSL
jgi:hypothetical protein